MNTVRLRRERAVAVCIGLLLIGLLAWAGCAKDQGSPSEDQPSGVGKETPPAKGGPAAPGGQAGSWVVNKADGAEALRIAIAGSNVTIDYGGQQMVSEAKSGARRYRQAGKDIGKVKGDSAKFKLKDPSGALLWKVKVKGDKIKIADNDELANAYSIKDRGGGSYKVKRGDTELGKVTFKSDSGKVKVKDAEGNELFVIKTDKRSAMYGLLLLTDIPEAQRYVLMAELAVRGH